jgi:hypothetical protein
MQINSHYKKQTMVKYPTNTHRYAAVSTSAFMISECAKSLQLYDLTPGAMYAVQHILEHAEKIEFIERLTVIPGAEILTGEHLRQIYAAAKSGTDFIVETSAISFQTAEGWKRIDNMPMSYTAKKMHTFIEKWRRERADQDTAAATETI